MFSRASQRVGSATVIALALAAILPAPSARAQGLDPAAATNEVLALMNQERASRGVAPLARHCDLDRAAARHASDMALNNFTSHTGSDGSTFDQRVKDTGYPYPTNENIAWYWRSPQEAMASWMSSNFGHREAILNPDSKDVGIAYAYGPNSNFGNYWVVAFGGGGGRQCGTVTPPTGVQVTSRPLGGLCTSNSAPLYDARYQRLYAFVFGTNGVYYRARQSSATSWEEWKGLGSVVKGNPAAGLLLGGAPTVFARGGDDAIWFRTRVGLGRNATTGDFEDTFSDWTSLGGVATSDPVVASNSDGHPEIFVRGTDNALYHQWQLANGTWSGWSSLGGILPGTPAIGINQDGRLAVFVLGADNGLWIQTQLGAGASSTWSGWNSIGEGLASDPVVTQLANGRMAVCYRKADNTIAAQWQLAPNHAGWTDAASLGSPNGGATGNPSVVVAANGQLHLFLRSSGGTLYRRVSTTADPGAGWGDWATLQFTASQDPVAFRQPTDGSASLLAVDSAGALWELLPSSPSGLSPRPVAAAAPGLGPAAGHDNTAW
jgi:uncharacterized protein YkwD